MKKVIDLLIREHHRVDEDDTTLYNASKITGESKDIEARRAELISYAAEIKAAISVLQSRREIEILEALIEAGHLKR